MSASLRADTLYYSVYLIYYYESFHFFKFCDCVLERVAESRCSLLLSLLALLVQKYKILTPEEVRAAQQRRSAVASSCGSCANSWNTARRKRRELARFVANSRSAWPQRRARANWTARATGSSSSSSAYTTSSRFVRGALIAP